MPTSWDNLGSLEGKNIRDDLKNNPRTTLDSTYQVPSPDPNQGLLKTQRYHSPDSSHWWYHSRSRDVRTMQGWWTQLGSCWHWVVPRWFGWWSRRRWVCLHWCRRSWRNSLHCRLRCCHRWLLHQDIYFVWAVASGWVYLESNPRPARLKTPPFFPKLEFPL